MNEKIENLLKEERKFPPPQELIENANATDSWYTDAEKNRLEFWQKQALTRISWFKEPTEILDDSNPPFFKWFKDGELNLSYNCLDRHLESDGERVAFYWEGEPGDTQKITYQDLKTINLPLLSLDEFKINFSPFSLDFPCFFHIYSLSFLRLLLKMV